MPDNTEAKPRRFLSRQMQAARYGKSVKTIERWGTDPRMAMPAEYDFHGLKARREDELERWERSRVAALPRGTAKARKSTPETTTVTV